MSNSQNTKNEQLTEQWKKGELPEGHYYVKDGENMIAEYLDGYFYNNGEPMTSFNGGVDSVLEKVPSYKEWQAKLKEELELRKANDKIIALESELKEVCDVLIRKCPEMKEWVMMNWKNLYEVLNA